MDPPEDYCARLDHVCAEFGLPLPIYQLTDAHALPPPSAPMTTFSCSIYGPTGLETLGSAMSWDGAKQHSAQRMLVKLADAGWTYNVESAEMPTRP